MLESSNDLMYCPKIAKLLRATAALLRVFVYVEIAFWTAFAAGDNIVKSKGDSSIEDGLILFSAEEAWGFRRVEVTCH